MGAITRSADHYYTFQGETYPGVTGILKVLDKSGPLMSWAARNTAEAAVEQIDALPSLLKSVGPEGVVKALTARANWKRDEAANLGTEVHHYADMLVNGRELPDMADSVKTRVKHYAAWWQTVGWTLRLSEAAIVNPSYGYGGTFDLLARDPDGRTVLADVKTGKGIYHEAVLQLAAYSMGDYVAPFDSDKAYPMPAVDRFVILHVTTEGVREVEIAVGQAERTAFLACIELHRWRETIKGKRL